MLYEDGGGRKPRKRKPRKPKVPTYPKTLGPGQPEYPGEYKPPRRTGIPPGPWGPGGEEGQVGLEQKPPVPRPSARVGDPGGPGPAAWRYQFYLQHGRWPNEQDYEDYKWSLDFQRLYGRPPSEEDWKAHWFASQGGGGGGGGGEEPKRPETIGEILHKLLFPEEYQLPVYMRDFGRYIEELLTQNPEFAIAPPKFNEQGELIPPTEEAAEKPLEEFESVEAYAQAWNEFLETLKTLSLEEQQYYQGLRYSPETGWYRSGAVPLLPHPEYL